MPNRYYAHTLTNPDGTPRPMEQWEPLDVHLQQVAELAAEFASLFGARDWGHLVGLWHDLGKYSAAFQQRLHDKSIHAPHAGMGAAFAYKQDARVGCFAAFVIAGHHTGLANLTDSSTGPTPLRETIQKNREPLTSIMDSVPVAIRDTAFPPLPSWLDARIKSLNRNDGLRCLTFFTRMLFSCLVDADRLKTANFYAMGEGRPANHALLEYDSLPQLLGRLDAHIDKKCRNTLDDPTSATPMNRLRMDVLTACRQSASKRPGMFSLTVPTGGGKTLSGMSFALRHAMKWNLKRVIVVIPFTSIIKQNADRYKAAFSIDGMTPDEKNVLEHHSAIDEQERKEQNAEQELRRQTAAENWDAPVIVTTTVQFFESLLSNHPSRCRKLHRIANSVVVLDEVQTLPPALLLPILEALRELTMDYRCSIVLSTATPPALEKRSALPHGLTDIEPIIPDAERLFGTVAARRVQVEWRIQEKTPYAELATEMSGEQQVLAIVHRRKDAHELCELLPSEDRFHLSALMCPAHRIERIAAIERALEDRSTCRVVSTQLIEAGVDVDFPVVYRALAGLDSLAQSAGRCDREGLRTEAAGRPAGRFIVFRAPTEPPGETLRKALQATETLLEMEDSDNRLSGGLDLLNPDHARLFFEQFYQSNRLDEKQVLTALSGLNFANASERFQMIADQGMRPIVVPWGEGPERAKRFQRQPSRETARGLQPFMVQVNRHYFDHVAQRGLIEVLDGSVGVPTSLFSQSWYSDEFGLEPDPTAPLPPDVTIA